MSDRQYSLSELNQMTQDEFTNALGAIWEETPIIAAKAWCDRPFADCEALYRAMVIVVENMSDARQLALIKAHPDLGSKTKMAVASVREQAGVGLNRLTTEEYQRFTSLNQAYQDRFDFPFIIAVKNHTKEGIFQAFERRLHNSVATEKQQALIEISQIARFRLQAIVE